MISPAFSRRLTRTEQDALWQRVGQQFALNPADWFPLVLNDVPLGFLNQKWRELLAQDWPQTRLQAYQNGLALSADNWFSMGDQLQHIARTWCDLGLFDGWRNEQFDVYHQQKPLFSLERAAFRVFGLQSHAIHINGLTEHNGHWQLWIARRSPLKAVDPNKLDNLVGGGIASGESAAVAMQREGWEEAGLAESLLQAQVCQSKHLSLRPVARGLHRECLHIFEVVLEAGYQPENQDGEVAEFQLMPLEDVINALQQGLFMNDALVTSLDLFHRHHLLDADHPLTQWLEQKKLPF